MRWTGSRVLVSDTTFKIADKILFFILFPTSVGLLFIKSTLQSYKEQLQYFDGLMQERCNSIANALELHLSCTNPSIWNT